MNTTDCRENGSRARRLIACAVYLSVGGQFRNRVERVSNLALNPGPEHTDAFGLVRALVHADLHWGERLRLFIEGKHAVALGRDLPGGRRPLDHDEWEFYASTAFTF